MVGLLTALPRTRLHARLAAEGRLLGLSGGGNNTHDLDLNFVPRMEAGRLKAGYKRVLKEVYRPRRYFARCLDLLGVLKHRRFLRRRIGMPELRACLHSLVRQTFTSYGTIYWFYLLRALWRRPRLAPEIVALAVKGHHFFTITRGLLELESFKEGLERLRRKLELRMERARQGSLAGLEAYRMRLLRRAMARCNRLGPDFRSSAFTALQEFRSTTASLLRQGLGLAPTSGRSPAG